MLPPNNHLNIASLFAAPFEVRVTHVRLRPSGLAIPTFEHIELLAGDGWVKSREEVVADVGRGIRYYTDQGFAPRAYLEVVQLTMFGSKYVRTMPDSTIANNLLSLPRF